jgi:hypothetical protein
MESAHKAVSIVIITTRDEFIDVLDSTVRALQLTSACDTSEILVVDDAKQYPRACDVGRRPGASSRCIDRCVSVTPTLACCRQRRRSGLDRCSHKLCPRPARRMPAHVHSGALLCTARWDCELTRPLYWDLGFIWRPKRDYAAGYCAGFDLRYWTKAPTAVSSKFQW